MKSQIPSVRVRAVNRAEIRPEGDFVLYWMVANRRVRFNFSLDRAVEWARELRRPLVVLETLRCDGPWAGARFRRFVVEGMEENAGRLQGLPVTYYPHIEPAPGAGKGPLVTLARQACLVVTDDFPAFVVPRMIRDAAEQLPVRLEAVDSNGLFPMRAAERAFPTAHGFRRHLQRHLPPHLIQMPKQNSLAGVRLPGLRRLPPALRMSRIPAARGLPETLIHGGSRQAERALRRFLKDRMDRYENHRNEPEEEVTSGLSPYLHFGHISTHEVFSKIARCEEWSPDRLSSDLSGSKSGWWGMGKNAEAFLDELVTWRELGFNLCAHGDDYDRFESLPAWAKATLKKHAGDPRKPVYKLARFENAETHDPLWNTAQVQLRTEGRIHNYLRMLWGKKILHWSRSPEEALGIMLELNNKYALDGRDPNSYSGIFWVLGRYDRPWGPERPVFGTVRYMSSENTARKFRVKRYLAKYRTGT